MSASVISEHNNTNKDEWTQKVGALAWAPYPNIISTPLRPWPCLIYPSWSIAILNSGLFPAYHQQNSTVSIDPSNPDIDSCDSTLAILSCKKRVKLSDLANNRVPLRVALNPGRNDGDSITKSRKRRSKVVVHFLGLNEWHVASIEDLTQYTAEAALKSIKQYREHASDENDGGFIKCVILGGEKRKMSSTRTGMMNRKRKNDNMDDWWDYWLLAMKEASIACEKEFLDPALLVVQCKGDESKSSNNNTEVSSISKFSSNSKVVAEPSVQIKERSVSMQKQGKAAKENNLVEHGVSRCKDDKSKRNKNNTEVSSSTRKLINSTNIKIVAEPSVQIKERSASIQKQENAVKENNLVEHSVKCTPECFDDWKIGGNTNTEKFSDTSQSQFLLTNQTKTQ